MGYKCEIIADSVNEKGDRITSFVVTYPRIIHSEFLRHRMLSRNTASSRAIPTKKMFEMVDNEPFTPIAWQKSHKGMQGSEYVTDEDEIKERKRIWLDAKDDALYQAKKLQKIGITKQLINRLVEPFQWTTEIITATELENFFDLRCPKYRLFSEQEPLEFRSKKDLLNYVKRVESDEFKNQYDNLTELDWLQTNHSGAEIHIQKIAEMMWDKYNESQPKQLKEGQWHIPFGDNIDENRLQEIAYDNVTDNTEEVKEFINESKIKIATARCARVSYVNFEGKDDYHKDIELHGKLYNMNHASPFEHCAKAMNNSNFCRNFKGFEPYRNVLNL